MKIINNLEFELLYSGEFCDTFKSLDKAIKRAVDAYKANEGMNNSKHYYSIKLGSLNNTVATIKFIDGNILIENN